MTYEEIESIFELTESLPYERRRFAFRDGMRILFDLFEESDDVHAEHDQLWYGTVSDVLDKIKPDQVRRLAELCWFIDEDSFSFFT